MRLKNVIGLWLLVGLWAVPTLAVGEVRFEKTACPFLIVAPEVDGETILCGMLSVPESRHGLSDKTIQLAVAVLKSTNPEAGDPVIYFEGGPGGAALTSATSYWVTSSIREYADVILLDQRGTGYSQPTLNCTEYTDPNIDPDANLDQVCHDRLVQEGIALGAYTSEESASDVADLIASLGLKSVNIYGISYGTRLALTVMRDHPEHVRSAIIEGVYPPNVQGYDEEASDGVRAFEVMFNDCAASRSCNKAYPNLGKVFYTMIDDLNTDPMVGTDEFGDPLTVSGDDVVNDLFGLFYDTTMIPYIPAIIVAASQRDYDAYVSLGAVPATDISSQLDNMTDEEFDKYMMTYLGFATVQAYIDYASALTDDEWNALIDEVYNQGNDISAEEQAALDAKLMQLTDTSTQSALDDYLATLTDEEYYALIDQAYGTVDGDSEGMFNSVECYEEVHFNSVVAAESLVSDVQPAFANALLLDVNGMFSTCELWDIGTSGAIENEPVRSNIPTLVLNGQYDPITPPSWGQAAADYLPNHFYFIFPGMGHGVVDLDPCPTDIARQFLENPTQKPDDTCIAQMGAPLFYLGD